MRKLNIEITNAKILGYEVTFNEEGEPMVRATIGLCTAGGKQIASYTVSNKQYYGQGEPFNLTTDIAVPILGVAQELERIITKHCRDDQKALAAPKTDNVPF